MPRLSRYYPAVIERAGSGVSVWFPDLPGLVSAGRDASAAAASALEALEAHLALAKEQGEAVPEPSLVDVTAAPPGDDSISWLMVGDGRAFIP